MTDVTQPEDPVLNRSIYNRVPPNAPVEKYRPMEVTFDMRVYNIRAHCLTYSPCSGEEGMLFYVLLFAYIADRRHYQIYENFTELCPVLYTEEVAVLIKKGYSETLIQVGVGACAAYFERISATHSDGYLTLSGLQFRGHAMFSSEDCPWDMAVVEYGWLMEILIGEVGGCLGSTSQVSIFSPQSYPTIFLPFSSDHNFNICMTDELANPIFRIISLANFFDTLLLLVIAKDEEKIVPERFKFCQHGQTAATCTKGSQPGRPCESEERLKYRQMRLSVDGVHLALADENSAFTIVVDPLRFTLCNAHEKRFMEHICLRIPNITTRQCRALSKKSWGKKSEEERAKKEMQSEW
ncbi:unnamed protein product, partial [Strongylus vulgaris]